MVFISLNILKVYNNISNPDIILYFVESIDNDYGGNDVE